MDFKIEAFISPQNLETLRRTGLHKTAGVMHGISEMTAPHAVAIIAAKARQKRAEQKLIADGIAALGELRGEKVAAGMQIGKWLPHVTAGIPAALLGGGIGYALAPDDPQAEQKYMQRAALMGLLGGTLGSIHKAM